MFANFGSVFIACCLWFGLDSDAEVYSGFIALIGGYLLFTGATLYMCQQKIQQEPEKWNWSTILYAVGLKNVMTLREELQSVCGYMPWAWGFAMKHLIPQVLLILFINLCRADNGKGKAQFGNYGSYVNMPFQFLGILCVCLVFVIAVVGMAVPAIFEPFDLTTIEVGLAKDVKAAAGDEESVDSKKSEEGEVVVNEEAEA